MNTAVLMRELIAAVDAPVVEGDAVGPICSTRPRRAGSAAAPTRSYWRRRRTTSPACRLVLRARRSPHRPRRRERIRGRGGTGRRRRRRARGPADGAVDRAAAVARRDRERRDDTRGAAAGARARALLPARPRRGRAVPARRQRRDERRRAPRVQVRRHRRLGDEHRGRDRARRARHFRQRRAQGRRRLRRALAADRLGRDARDRDGGPAEADSPAGGTPPGGRVLRRRRRGNGRVLHAMASGTLPAAIEFLDSAAFAISAVPSRSRSSALRNPRSS